MGFSLVSGGKGNLWLGKFDIFPDDIFSHAVSTRIGGFSAGEFSSLNMGLHVGDDKSSVLRNRSSFLDSIGIDLKKAVTCRQVHGTKVAKVSAADWGRGAKDYEDSIPDVDAMVTDEPNVPLVLFFADCTPVIVADPKRRAIGLAHAGWKGTVGGIAMKTVSAMTAEFGSDPKDMVAAVAPSIGVCCYEVGREVADAVKTSFPDMANAVLKAGRIQDKFSLDLWQFNKMQLLKSGLPDHNIEVAEVCTSCNNEMFFSYRADKGKTGRIGAVISIKG